MWKSLLLVGVSILPLRAESACTGKDLQGRYVSLIGGELSGFWSRCDFRVKASGLATGSCSSTAPGATGPIDPIQLSVSPSCSVSGRNSNTSFSLRIQPHKRGLIGRFRADDGVNVIDEGPVVAVKRGK